MLSKAQIKHIRSLSLQKYRKEYQQFIAEGEKIAREWLQSDAPIHTIVVTKEWAETHADIINKHSEAALHIVEESILAQVSSLKTPNKALLVVNLTKENITAPLNEWVIILDDIQDPGNMGSIIRTADWFGIKNLVCSKGCVDVHNTKVIQAAMGSHLRVHFFEEDLDDYLGKLKMPVLAAVLNGENIYKMQRLSKAALLIGNEGNGLHESLITKATHKVTIPTKGGAESLNAAIATGILCALLTPQ